ncbi:TPA: 50S ribosomal protein L23 [Neisseria meningitidis]
MNQQRLTQVILAPIVSEKSNVLAEKRNQMTFKVLANATKPEIKAAVELLFGVQVASVTTVTTKGKTKRSKGKTKRFGRTLGRRSDVKKAYVSLAAGQELDLEAAAAAADKE